MRVTVLPDDSKVIVDGEMYVCDFETDPNIHAIQYEDNDDDPFRESRGVIETKVGDNEIFKGRAKIVPFLEAFEVAKYEHKRRKDAEEKQAEAKTKAEEKARKKRLEDQEAERIKRQPLVDAYRMLADTDHEVIKAYEGGYDLDPELKKERDLARKFIKENRDALG